MLRFVRRLFILSALLVAAWGLIPSPAEAHQPRPTLVTVSAGADVVHPSLTMVAEIPLDKLGLAYGIQVTDDPARAVKDHAQNIADLVKARVTLMSTGGAWTVRVTEVQPSSALGRDTARVELTATPPAGTSPDQVTLRWEAITDVVFSHKVYVAGVDADGRSQLVGIITAQQSTVPLEVSGPAAASAPPSMLTVGFAHFREGTDHQLFLCLLVLAAARRRATKWVTVRRLLALTLMFTVGHSLSLALATSGLVTPPSRWVEVGIATTILLAAIHAVRPVLSGRVELAITGLFGLVHGFGFAGTLIDLSLTGRGLVLPVLSFNIGLEAAQLLALLLFVVPVWVLARSSAASGMLAVIVGAVAASWIAQRALDIANPVDALLTSTITSPERVALVLAGVAAVVEVDRRVRRRSETAAPPHAERAFASTS